MRLAFGLAAALEISLQTGISLFRTGKIDGLQGAGQALKVRVRLTVVPEGLAGLRLRTARQILLEGGQGGLSAREIARLQGFADGIEIIDELDKRAKVR